MGYEDRCVWWVEPLRYPVDGYQCTRKAGYGPGHKYCAQHAKKVRPSADLANVKPATRPQGE